MAGLTTESYVPILRSKLGEHRGYLRLSPGALGHTTVQWVIPARSQRDVEERRYLDADEYVRANGRRIGLISAGRRCFVDVRFALRGFPEGDVGPSIVRLFRMMREGAGQPAPVLDLTSASSGLTQAIASVLNQQNYGAALRLDAEAMEDADLPGRLKTTLQLLDLRSSDATLLLDFANAELDDSDDSAALIEHARDRLLSGFDWNGIVFQSTSYPHSNPARKDSIAVLDRPEFSLWKRLVRRSRTPKGDIVFGDYGADNASFEFDGQGRPSPHLRSSSDIEWIVSKGDRDSDRATTMKAVAKRIAERDDFRGEGFSWGDGMVVDMAAGDKTGNPTTWRSVSTSHHLERTCRDIGVLLGFKMPEYSRIRRGVQFEMKLG
jgi:hypothetical protein